MVSGEAIKIINNDDTPNHHTETQDHKQFTIPLLAIDIKIFENISYVPQVYNLVNVNDEKGQADLIGVF